MSDPTTKPLPPWRLALARAARPQLWPAPLRRYLVHKALPRRRVRDFPFEVNFFGLRFNGNAANSLEYEILKRGAFEHGILLFMQRVAACGGGAGGIFVDVGANVGQHSLFMSQHAAAVTAFEPLDFLADQFEALMQLNGIRNVELRRVALSDRRDKALLAVPGSDNLGTGTLDLEFEAAQGKAQVEVELRRGTDELGELARPIFLIKIDVEGHEVAVLDGMRDVLARHRPVVVLEILNTRLEDYPSLRRAFPERYRYFAVEKLYRRRIVATPWDGVTNCGEIVAIPEDHPALGLLERG